MVSFFFFGGRVAVIHALPGEFSNTPPRRVWVTAGCGVLFFFFLFLCRWRATHDCGKRRTVGRTEPLRIGTNNGSRGGVVVWWRVLSPAAIVRAVIVGDPRLSPDDDSSDDGSRHKQESSYGRR